MLKKLTVRLAVFLLRQVALEPVEREYLFKEVVDVFKKKQLSNEEKQILTATMLEKLGALPLHAKIIVDGTGKVFVNGRSLDLDTAERLKQAAVSMRGNAARNLVRETVTFLAIMDGVHRNVTPDMGLFAKAALWFMQEEDKLYDLLAQDSLLDE